MSAGLQCANQRHKVTTFILNSKKSFFVQREVIRQSRNDKISNFKFHTRWRN